MSGLLLDGEHGRVGDQGLALVDSNHGAHGGCGDLFFGRGRSGLFFGRRGSGWFFGRRGNGIDSRGRDLAALSRLWQQQLAAAHRARKKFFTLSK